jgi:hypothetical protein
MQSLAERTRLLYEGRELARRHHEAPSLPWQPMRHVEDIDEGPRQQYEIWENDRYTCSVRRYARGFFLGNSRYITLGITALDQTARHDWRDFQACKTDICGPEWEGIELYPAESRLQDPSNRFYLWCVPKGLLRFGGTRREVCTPGEAIAPQRPFPEGTL